VPPAGDVTRGEGQSIRRAVAADLPRIVELLIAGALPGAPNTEDSTDADRYQDALEEIQGAGGEVLVVERRGEVVGFCQLLVFRHLQAKGGLCAELESVHVQAEHRGTGIGRALVRAAVDRARALGCYRVQLTSNRQRQDAHRFYESLGFEPSHVGYKLRLD
jgi:GNAT superfamily N-acetyltransferase